MNTRSRQRSESGYGESELPIQGAKGAQGPLHRVYEDSPRSPSITITAAAVTGGIPRGRVLERSPPRHMWETAQGTSMGTSGMSIGTSRMSMGTSMGPPVPAALHMDAGTRLTGETEGRDSTHCPASPARRHTSPAHRDSSPVRHTTSPTRRPTSPACTERTTKTHRSTVSAAARMKLAEYEAEKELAELEEKRIQIKKALVKKRLEAEISAIEASEYGSSAGGDDHERVKDWIDRSVEHAREGQPSARRQKEPEEVHPPRTEVRGEEKSRGRGIEQLADVLERMVQTRPPPRQTAELPPFSGAISEWLPFKAAMEDSTRLYKFSATENLLRLRNSLRGEARETVLSQLFTATHPDLIMRTLEMKYGRPEYIVDRAMEELKRLPRVGNTSTELNELAIKVQNIVYTMKSIDRRGYLQNPMLVRDVMDKLSPHLVSKWAEYAVANEDRIVADNEMTVLSEFLMNEADRVLRYTHTARRSVPVPVKKEQATKRVATRERVYATEGADEVRTPNCFMCQSVKHYTPECPKLRVLDINERWRWAKEQRLCFKCMKRRHSRNTCKAKACGIKGCKYQHHAILHKEMATGITTTVDTSKDAKEDYTPAAVMSVTSKATPGTVLLKTCQVRISGPRGEIITHALLDEGSTVTLIEEDLARKIAYGGPSKPLNIKGINEHRRVNSKSVEIKVQGLREHKAHTVTARTIRGLELHQQRVPQDLGRYKHLRGIAEKISSEEARPQLLIGADNWHLIVSRQLRAGKRNEPAASWTMLGWVLHGSVPRRMLLQDEESVLHLYDTSSDLRLERLVEGHFEVDSLGITTKTRINERDQRAASIFEATVRRKDGHFEVGLPWKMDNPALPDNYECALKRLRTLERKMEREPEFKGEYGAQIRNLIEKGYATECDGSEEGSKVKWYLPHFAVTNHNKPGRVRMVFDAAAKAHGVSLNDYLLEGPDLLASLTRILFGFREKKIAVTADIQEMFLRIKIRPEDQPAQMFLWRDRSTDPPRRLKMTSLIFGATSSPYLAHSVRNRNAADYEVEYPEAAWAIRERHYMDDYLDSFQTEEEAMRVIRQVIHVHEQASFNLRGWNSNNMAVLESIPRDKISMNADVKLAAYLQEKTLGLIWNPRTDTLGFNTDIKRVPEEVKHRQRAPTKRETLSAVMSIYDPLGLISQYTIVGKIILQQLWMKKIGWDEELPPEEAEEFKDWIKRLPDVSALTLPRCYSLDMTPGSYIELHVFNDASEQAYATAAYWRIVHEDGTVETVQVMAKAKVAPLKILTIPRLELQAALIGARMANTIIKEHSWKPKRVFYWTDSRTVLHWIRNEAKKYTPFVAHRLAEIAELSQKADWHWVPTAHNVADDATRIRVSRISSEDRWFTGPQFLKTPEESWPVEDQESILTEEVVYNVLSGDTSDLDGTLPDINRFSAYQKLIRSTALVQLFVQRLKTRNKDLPLEVSHLQEAEQRWIRRAQRDSFGEELDRIGANQQLPRNSRLNKLDPVMEDNILRAKGRIGAFEIATHSKRPAIIDGRHPFTRLLIESYHRSAGHANNERVVNELRQRFIILHLRPTVRMVARGCQFCKVYKATPKTPPRGDLPKGRLDPGHRAFTYSGVDYFGPMTVTIGRRHEKRWCALFTCLTTRAIHLELVSSLSTDSVIMALRRMAARRGWPRTIYSDNATNFRGADVELRSAYKRWAPELRNFGLRYGTDWRFIPPGAPHMGGTWERLVRSVKTALSTTLREKSPKEEVLQTLLTEAEYSVNARPLTHVSVDPSDEEALTPNHFLIGSSTGLPLTGPCEEADRSTWRKAQALADQFWQRWIYEYLPTLIPRGQARTQTQQLQVGDAVIVVDNTLPRNTWPRGIIERVYPGPDGVVRSADVRTRGGIFRRPATKLAVLQLGKATMDLRRGENVTDGGVDRIR